MRIIKNNYQEVKPELFPVQIKCPHCSSELEYDKPDIIKIPVPYSNDFSKSFEGTGFVCPCCNGLIILG